MSTSYRLLSPAGVADRRSRANAWLNPQSYGLSSRRRWLILGSISLCLVLIWSFNQPAVPRRYNDFPAGHQLDLPVVKPSDVVESDPIPPNTEEGGSEVTLLIASMKGDDLSWLEAYKPEWEKKIYVTDDQNATLTVPRNKGREAMVYLTYIIDHYDDLAPVTIFHHASRYQWHNDDPLYDGERMLDRLQIKYILAQGYVNLRCVWTLGCPAEMHPLDEQTEQHTKDDSTGTYYAKAFAELFPEKPIPTVVGVSCCAQFAVSREKIRERPIADYKRFRQWLLDTQLRDHVSGRILEYSWHMIFGHDAVYCPNAKTCYCQLYGLCNLTCTAGGTCGSQYTLPPYSTLPVGWPEIGWDGEVRNITKMREEQDADYDPIR